MAQLLRKPSLVGYISQRFQQTQAKVAKVSFKEPHQPLGRLAVGPVFKNARLFPDKVAIRDRIAGMLFFGFVHQGGLTDLNFGLLQPTLMGIFL